MWKRQVEVDLQRAVGNFGIGQDDIVAINGPCVRRKLHKKQGSN